MGSTETTDQPTEHAHLITTPDGDTFVAMCGADAYASAAAYAEGYRVQWVEGYSRRHGFKITKRY